MAPAREHCEDHDLELADLLDLNQMQQLLDSFSEATGVASGLADARGQPLTLARWRPICQDFHRAHPRALARCTESETLLAARSCEAEGFSCQQCQNGLMLAACADRDRRSPPGLRLRGAGSGGAGRRGVFPPPGRRVRLRPGGLSGGPAPSAGRAAGKADRPFSGSSSPWPG